MRITNKMMTTKYTRSLNTLSTDLNTLNTQVSSGRKFSNSSEDTSAAVKAYKIRSDLSKIESYQSNIQYAQSSLTNAETSLTSIEDLLQAATEKIVQGMNSTQSETERKIIATELRSIQDELFQTLNTNVSGTYIFGGTNTDNPPFEVVGGKLQYNGTALDSLDGSTPELITLKESLEDDSLYVNIGLNLQFDSTSTLNKTTAFGYSVTGINIVGSGTTTVDGVTDPVSNNLYDLLGQIATEFESSDYSFDELNSIYGKFTKSTSGVSQCITGIGAKGAYLEFMTERYVTQNLNLEERQLSVEGVDAAETIIQYKSQQVAYEAALQMGASVLQSSIFDYMS